MGKETPLWQYVETPEDVKRLHFFDTLFEQHVSLLKREAVQSQKIPKVIHFIWLGPEDFPQSSVEHIAKWIEKHPHWVFKFWTDLDRPLPLEQMEKCLVGHFSFSILGDEYFHSTNFGEKAKILAYEILLQQGGVYIDHDVVPFKSFDRLNEQLDFYCGLEPLAPSILSSSIIPGTQLMGARSSHPILKEAALWLHSHWEQMEQNFPGNTKTATANRIWHRTLWALSEGIDKGINQQGNCDIVFPSVFFNDVHRKASSYAVHYHDAIWSSSPSKAEMKVKKDFQEMIKTEDEAIKTTLFLAGMSLLAWPFLIFYARSTRKVIE